MGSDDALSAFLYFITTVMSLGAGGSTVEACDLADTVLGVSELCTGRIKTFIAFSFLTAFIAIPLMVTCVFDISIIKTFEFVISPISVAFAIVACAIGTSLRTVPGVISLPPFLMWYSLISASAAMFLSLKKKGQGFAPKEKLADPNPVSVSLAGSVASSIPTQPMHPSYAAPTQPVEAGTLYSAPNSPIVYAVS